MQNSVERSYALAKAAFDKSEWIYAASLYATASFEAEQCNYKPNEQQSYLRYRITGMLDLKKQEAIKKVPPDLTKLSSIESCDDALYCLGLAYKFTEARNQLLIIDSNEKNIAEDINYIVKILKPKLKEQLKTAAVSHSKKND